MLKTRNFSFNPYDFVQVYLNDALVEDKRASVLNTHAFPWLQDFYVYEGSCITQPFFYSCWTQTLDGQLTLKDNKKGRAVAKALKGKTPATLLDFWWLNLARSLADGVIIGAQTLREEPYLSAHIWDEQLIKVRRSTFEKQPLQIIFSLSGNLGNNPFLLSQDFLSVLIYTSRQGLESLKSSLKGPWQLVKPLQEFSFHKKISIFLKEDFEDLQTFLDYLENLGLRRVLVESPSLACELLKFNYLQEMWISTAGIYSGQKTGSSKAFDLTKVPQAELLSLHLCQARYLYARYRVLKDI